MPLHILDWAKIEPPSTQLPFPLESHHRQHLFSMLRAALDPPVVRYSEVEADEWDLWTPPDFLAVDGLHPDIGWEFRRLICPLEFEMRYTMDSDTFADQDWWEEEQTGERLHVRQNSDRLIVDFDGATLDICRDGVVLVSYDGLVESELCVEHDLISALQSMTGLAFHCPRGLRCFEPVECAICAHRFVTIVMSNDNFEGCPRCGVEWVWVKDAL